MTHIFTREVEGKFSDCNDFHHVNISRILCWCEDIRFEVAEFLGLNSYMDEEYKIPGHSSLIPNPDNHSLKMPILRMKIVCNDHLKAYEKGRIITKILSIHGGQIVFLQEIFQDNSSQPIIAITFGIGMVGKDNNLIYNAPDCVLKRIQPYIYYDDCHKS